MDFDFTPDQRRLQEEVARLLAAKSTSAEIRQTLEGVTLYSEATWKGLAELGALGVAIPEEHGGAGLGPLELCLVAEEAGRALAPVPLLPSIYLAARAIQSGGDEAQRRAWLPRLASGETIATAIFPTGQSVRKHAPVRLEGGKLYGEASAVPDLTIASIAIVDAGGELVLVHLDAPGVQRAAEPSIDPTRPIGRVDFTGAAVERLRANYDALAEEIVHGAAVLAAFEQLGGASRMLDTARDYALQRRAFGRLIGGFQAIKHKLADIYVARELAKAHCYYAAWALSTRAPELPLAAAAARASATKAYDLAAEEGLHIHGGIGFTWEMDCHLHVRRARWLGEILGGPLLWRARLADQIIAAG